EDFRYWFEDIAENPELSPSGLPLQLLPNGERPQFEVLDAQTVRFTWSRPNPMFLPAMAVPDPMFIYRPAHYLKKFHGKYTDKETLTALAKQIGDRNWAALHNKMDVMYRNDNPDRPARVLARHQPTRDQSGERFRPAERRAADGLARDPAVPARLPRGLRKLRSGPSEPAARSERPEARRRQGHAAIARRGAAPHCR